MRQPVEILDISSLSDAEITALLGRLDSEERLISMQRRRLHERIDNGALKLPARALVELRHEERLISERRLQLHRRINEIRIERGRRIARSHVRPVD